MKVLIVEGNPGRARLWQRELAQGGAEVRLATTPEAAVACLGAEAVDVIVLNLALPRGDALAVADYAAYRRPGARIVVLTAASAYSDGSIFTRAPNACACLRPDTAPEELAAVVEYHGRAA